MNKEKFKQLLEDVSEVLKNQKKEQIESGENFNIFTILDVGSYENKTHSGFIFELLNPAGSHNQGYLFLELFLEAIDYTGKKLDYNNDNNRSITVKKEYYIGNVDNKNKTGGRIDIYIEDYHKTSISIENKIYAYDQECQIERYCNHNKDNNSVYYLNLFGDLPDEISIGKLEKDKDFFVISYKENIIKWLKKCLEVSDNIPILRETIRQYLILIQKLTYSMEKEEEEKLKEMMLKYYKASSYIANNFNNIFIEIREKIKLELIEKLKTSLNENEYKIEGSKSNFDKRYNHSQIYISLKNIKKNIYFVVDIKEKENEIIELGVCDEIGKFQWHNDLRMKLKDELFFQELIDDIIEQIKGYINLNKEYVIKIAEN